MVREIRSDRGLRSKLATCAVVSLSGIAGPLLCSAGSLVTDRVQVSTEERLCFFL